MLKKLKKLGLILTLVCIVGAGLKPDDAMADSFDITIMNPLDTMRETSDYGYRKHPILGSWLFHSGLDLGAPSGTPIYAVADGVVKFSGNYGSYGNLVIIKHKNDMETYYAHASENLVTAGESVNAGDVISLVGSTGRSTGPHLHFEVRVNNVVQNPKNFLGKTFNIKDSMTREEFLKIKNEKQGENKEDTKEAFKGNEIEMEDELKNENETKELINNNFLKLETEAFIKNKANNEKEYEKPDQLIMRYYIDGSYTVMENDKKEEVELEILNEKTNVDIEVEGFQILENEKVEPIKLLY